VKAERLASLVRSIPGTLMPNARKISLVLADVDGTLLTKEKSLTTRATAAVRALKEARIRFAIASSRPPRGLAMLIEPLALDTPIAAFNGGIYILPDLSVIRQQLLDSGLVREVVAAMRDRGLDVWFYTAMDWLVSDPDGSHVRKEAATVQFEPVVIANLDAAPPGIAKVVGVSDDHDLVQRCGAELQRLLRGGASVSRSQPYYVDITSKDANKGGVAELISAYLSVPKEEIATIGDSANDVLMFKHSGFSIAMGNAPNEVKAEAQVTTDSNEDDGFASAIERFVLPPSR
jgi:Cof subfamily protein (haloacid dehalogenase superfamily)